MLKFNFCTLTSTKLPSRKFPTTDVRPLLLEPYHHHPLHDLVEVVDGSRRNSFNQDVIVVEIWCSSPLPMTSSS
ncbi:exocyst complex component EXO70B1-like [Pyrus ussuriensis x Pyrus communis]|uniref:Exocyst complex component EXO70B1-like n=1 Tax=Pyrus ussuriensis x Pyrus communis TaxID=2448454 RepID=A0A5N5G491_9ROSA|nr:exocyst complex component EXO70B1-like [Pyrus ussuriensis x Pyrus communis]